MFTISIGVCVYNEEKNIGNLLNSLLNQKNKKNIQEIIVVSSACNDKTDKIIENDFLPYYSEIVLLKQKKREGKASAINLFLKYASGDIVVLESGDTIPTEDTIEKLTEPFKNSKIGMTGGRPVPVNDPNTFMGFTVHLLWHLHHKLAMKHPKLGELVAFRKNLIKEISPNTAVDEAYVEALIKEQGYELSYVPAAIVYNKGPETISDFLKQRRRIFAGHVHLKKTKGYTTSSMKKLDILKLMFEDVNLNQKRILWICSAILLESYGRLLGLYDFYIKKENPFIWNIAETTKENYPEITKIYNSEIRSTDFMAQRIKLWSMVKQQRAFSKSQTTAEAMVLQNSSASIPNPLKNMLKNPLDLKLPPTKEEIPVKNQFIKLIKMSLPVIIMGSVGIIEELLLDGYLISG